MPKNINDAKTLFFSTSPRNPELIAKYLDVLVSNFSGRKWEKKLQEELYYKFVETGVMEGGESSLPDLSGREKITRSVMPLGFVQLTPYVAITEPGSFLLEENNTDDLFLRQLIKLQYPSPIHIFGGSCAHFNCKPFLEVLRLINDLGYITKIELTIFGLQITDYHKLETIEEKIKKFRATRPTSGVKKYFQECLFKEVEQIYEKELNRGTFKTRESAEQSRLRFVKTKASNMRDYADACVRYLRYTGCIALSRDNYNYSISILEEKKSDVDFLLQSIDRDAHSFESRESYNQYLWDVNTPSLLSDNKDILIETIKQKTANIDFDLHSLSTNELKQLRRNIINKQRDCAVADQIKRLKRYADFKDVVEKFENIPKRGFYPDAPVLFEWNTWRAMTMLDGGEIVGNFGLDDSGLPKSSARGGMADIVCKYDDFAITVEVTLQTGARQFDSEGEPVARHVGKVHDELGKTVYCLFIAPVLNQSSIDFFFSLNNMNIASYGGSESCIIPIELKRFVKVLSRSYQYNRATPTDLKELFISAKKLAKQHQNHNSSLWLEDINDLVDSFLSPILVEDNNFLKVAETPKN